MRPILYEVLNFLKKNIFLILSALWNMIFVFLKKILQKFADKNIDCIFALKLNL